MGTLYELSNEYADLVYALENAENGEEQGWLEEQLAVTAESLENKAEAYAKVILNTNLEAEGITKEIERLTAMKKRKENTVKRLKEAVLNCMTQIGSKEVKTPIGAFRTRQNPYKCVVLDEDKIPVEFLIPQKPAVDKRAILSHFNDTGEIVPGCDFSRGMSISFK